MIISERMYIRQYTALNEYGYPHSNNTLIFYTSKTTYLPQNISCVKDVK